jgi:hypothetical protein
VLFPALSNSEKVTSALFFIEMMKKKKVGLLFWISLEILSGYFELAFSATHLFKKRQPEFSGHHPFPHSHGESRLYPSPHCDKGSPS